jgi:hypothetical protein
VSSSIAPIQDPVVDGTQISTITASAEGHLPGSTTVSVLDDDSAEVSLERIETRFLAGDAGNDICQFDADTQPGLYTLDEFVGGADTIDFGPTSTVSGTLNLSLATNEIITSNLTLNLGSSEAQKLSQCICVGR